MLSQPHHQTRSGASPWICFPDNPRRGLESYHGNRLQIFPSKQAIKRTTNDQGTIGATKISTVTVMSSTTFESEACNNYPGHNYNGSCAILTILSYYDEPQSHPISASSAVRFSPDVEDWIQILPGLTPQFHQSPTWSDMFQQGLLYHGRMRSITTVYHLNSW